MILVSGAAGNIGGALVRQLRRKGIPVRALIRSPEKAEAARALGAEITIGDLEDPASLNSAMAGVKRAFLLPPNVFNQAELEANFIVAAKQAGVERIVKISVPETPLNHTSRIFAQHGLAEKRLIESGVPYTILRPNFFMQNLLWFTAPIVATGRFAVPLANAQVAPIHTDDVAAVAAVSLTSDKRGSQVYSLTGPELKSGYDLAGELAKATNRAIEYLPTTRDAFAEVLRSWKMPDWLAEAIAASWHIDGQGHYAFLTTTVSELTGQTPLPFSRFATDYAGMFAGKG